MTNLDWPLLQCMEDAAIAGRSVTLEPETVVNLVADIRELERRFSHRGKKLELLAKIRDLKEALENE